MMRVNEESNEETRPVSYPDTSRIPFGQGDTGPDCLVSMVRCK